VTSGFRISTIMNYTKCEAPGEQTDKARGEGTPNDSGSINGHPLCLEDWPKPHCVCVCGPSFGDSAII
jgi:hypothetical protein